MKFSEQVRSISYLKSHAAEVLREVTERRRPMVITQHGEAKVVLQDVREYEEMQESIALLKMLAMSRKSAQAGELSSLDDAVERMKRRLSSEE